MNEKDCECDDIASVRRDTQKFIDQGIWTVVGVPYGSYNMFYTIGLSNHNLSEIIMFGPFEKNQGARIINDIAQQFVEKKVKWEVNKKIFGLLGDSEMPVMFLDANLDKIKQEHTVQATNFYGTESEYYLTQIVWPDHYKKFPWEENCEDGYLESQLIIGTWVDKDLLN